jgi:hypothetical protein
MYKRVGTLKAHVRKADGPVLRARVLKAPPLEPWRVAALTANPPPASHFGCVDWYIYEQSRDTKAAPGAEG